MEASGTDGRICRSSLGDLHSGLKSFGAVRSSDRICSAPSSGRPSHYHGTCHSQPVHSARILLWCCVLGQSCSQEPFDREKTQERLAVFRNEKIGACLYLPGMMFWEKMLVDKVIEQYTPRYLIYM